MDTGGGTISDPVTWMAELKIPRISRREFCHIAGAGVLLAPSFARAGTAESISAREVVERIRKNLGVPWGTFATADEFKIGDPDAPVTGITTTFMSTLDVLRRSVAAGNNFVITHEPTFWSANDQVSDLRDDPLFKFKVDFIRKNNIVVWRFHDHWHAHRPDGIFMGWNKQIGWESYTVKAASPLSLEYVIPETTLKEVAIQMQSKLAVRSMRIVGDPDLKITRVGNAGHYIGQCMALLPNIDLLLVFECREWEAAEYVRDAIALGQKKALIQLPHEAGEEPGMDECARWLRTFIKEVPINFIPSGDPFWLAS